ncbi:MAG: DMT family transporter [Candidatus Cloacimonadota bacterium]|nr:DMT family transporter [Candidatus Cloacimonadota bacterium]
MKKQNKAYILAIIAVLIWSTVGSAFKISLGYIDFLQLLFVSSAVAVCCTFAILIFQKKLPKLFSNTRRQLIHSAILGFLNPFFYYLVLLKGYSILPAQEAITLNYIWPIMLVLLSIPILRQKIKLSGIIAIFLSFLGVIIIATKGDIFGLRFSNFKSDLLPLSSAVIWALFWIYNIKDKRDDVIKLFMNFSFGFMYILLFSIFHKIDLSFLKNDPAGTLAAIYVGIFEMGLTFVIWLKALNLSKTTAQVSNFIYLTPFISLININIITKEKILFSTIVGLVFIISGIILQRLFRNPIIPDRTTELSRNSRGVTDHSVTQTNSSARSGPCRLNHRGVTDHSVTQTRITTVSLTNLSGHSPDSVTRITPERNSK